MRVREGLTAGVHWQQQPRRQNGTWDRKRRIKIVDLGDPDSEPDGDEEEN